VLLLITLFGTSQIVGNRSVLAQHRNRKQQYLPRHTPSRWTPSLLRCRRPRAAKYVNSVCIRACAKAAGKLQTKKKHVWDPKEKPDMHASMRQTLWCLAVLPHVYFWRTRFDSARFWQSPQGLKVSAPELFLLLCMLRVNSFLQT